MTQPAPPRQPRQPTQAQIGAVLAVLATAGTVGAVASGLAAATGISTAAAHALLDGIKFQLPVTPVTQLGPAARQVAAGEQAYRAVYLVNAAFRVQAQIANGRTYEQAVAAELPNWQAHLAAQANRAVTAVNVDRAAARHGSLVLGWKARMDARTSAECAAADGLNFRIDSRPLIGFPGSVHPHCRCRPVAAFAGAGWVDGTATTKVAKEAVA